MCLIFIIYFDIYSIFNIIKYSFNIYYFYLDLSIQVFVYLFVCLIQGDP